MRKKISKTQRTILKELARRLPETFTYARTTDKITGADAILTGLKPPKGEAAFDPEKEYLHDVPLEVPNNHFRRLCKAFQSGGSAAVTKYLSKFYQEAPKQEVEV